MATTTATTEVAQQSISLKGSGLESGPYGERLCVHVADELARQNPDRIYATITNSSHDIEHGFRDVTIKQFTNAVNYAAWDIQSRFGKSEDGVFDVLACIGTPDIRYSIYFYAAIKTGHQLMIPSVRNSFTQHLAVFEEAKCTRVLHTPNFDSVISQIKDQQPALSSHSVPDLDTLLNTPSEHYEYTRTWAEAKNDPVVVAHSSGSTGTPKPTTITHGVYSCYDNHRKIPVIPGRKSQSYALLALEGERFYNPFPPFHLAGFFSLTLMPIFYDCIVTTGPPEKPASGELVSQAMRKLKIRAAFCPPTVIEQLLEQPGGYEQAASLDWIMYTGGPLAKAVGDRLSTVTDVCQLYGSTETGIQVALIPKPEDWQWFEWHPLMENTLEDQGDGTYEMVIYKDPSLNWVRHLSHAYPHLDEWRTKDLFVRHPEKSYLWRFIGRKDDVLVLSNGEKFNPVNMEGAIVGHPLVRGALIVGTGRFQASLIVEPKPGLDMSKNDFIAEIWPTVQHANTLGPAHGRIFKHKIVVGKADKPLIRAGKGTVIRGQTTKLYAEEVDALYADDDQTPPATDLSSVEDLSAVADIVRACVVRHTSDNIDNASDFFAGGMDSLQTLEVTKSLNRALSGLLSQRKQGAIQAGLLYKNPTIDRLSYHLHRVLTGLEELGASQSSDRVVAMEEMIRKYSAGLFPRDTTMTDLSTAQGQPGKLCVAISGSTGSLGTHILRSLLADSKVGKIYCLNRSDDARSRQITSLNLRNAEDTLDDRIEFLTTNFGDAKFGLTEDSYAALSSSVDVVIHNAWKVDFNHDLLSFEIPHIAGIRHLIDFSLASSRQAHIAFVSSLSSVSNWPAVHVHGASTPVPEVAMTDSNVALQMGYGESKHVAERILQNAVEQAGVKSTILRVGQLAGPLADNVGIWNRTEWFPNLMKTSKAMRLLPDSMGTIEWIPVDTMATIIHQLVQNQRSSGSFQVFNLTNPTPSKWIRMLPAILEAWGTDLDIVPFAEWVDRLSRETDMEQYPALKILDFYRGLAAEENILESGKIKVQVVRAAEVSSAMADLKPIGREALASWIKQWGF
ncbi:NRPS-like enzyme [Sarocladium strictum]